MTAKIHEPRPHTFFPLDIVLFPGQAVPLHIFEQRYRLMTRHCIDTKSPFGIIFYHEGNLARTGCTAMIVKILKEYEDGRSDILTAGQQRLPAASHARRETLFRGRRRIPGTRISRESMPPFPRDSNSCSTSATGFFTSSRTPRPLKQREAFPSPTMSPRNCPWMWHCAQSCWNCGPRPTGSADWLNG